MTTAHPWFDGFTARRIATSGADIFVRTGGNASAPPLLLLHGFRKRMQCGTAWRSSWRATIFW